MGFNISEFDSFAIDGHHTRRKNFWRNSAVFYFSCIEFRFVQSDFMRKDETEADLRKTFYAAEQAGMKLAIKGRIGAILVVGVWLVLSRPPDRAMDFILPILLLIALGYLHHQIVGSAIDKPWVKFVFLTLDFVFLLTAIAIVPPLPGLDLPQVFVFRFDSFPIFFVILAVSAFSFSPALVAWCGVLGAGGWMGLYFWITTDMDNPINWSDIPLDANKEVFLSYFFNENFVPVGSRFQEAIVFLITAILIAVVMHRARLTVRRQLKAERDIAAVSNMFGRFVPQAIADLMIQDKGALNPLERTATVLFVDLAGFTRLTESKGPRVIVDILNQYFDRVTAIIGEHGGVVTQFQGDAVLATFNVPVEDNEHAKNALKAARAILAAVENERFAGEHLSIRIGLNTGPVIAGNVGGGGRQSYTVHGDAVNLAARLEALNKDHDTKILLSGEFARFTGETGLLRVGETDIRGLSEPVALYTLGHPSASPELEDQKA